MPPLEEETLSPREVEVGRTHMSLMLWRMEMEGCSGRGSITIFQPTWLM